MDKRYSNWQENDAGRLDTVCDELTDALRFGHINRFAITMEDKFDQTLSYRSLGILVPEGEMANQRNYNTSLRACQDASTEAAVL